MEGKFSLDFEVYNPSNYCCRQLDELGELLTSFLRELQEETGWAFTIFGGGLNHQGDVKVVT